MEVNPFSKRHHSAVRAAGRRLIPFRLTPELALVLSDHISETEGALASFSVAMIEIVEAGRADEEMTAKKRRELRTSLSNCLSRGIIPEAMRTRAEAAIERLARAA